MPSLTSEIQHILQHDIDPEFLEKLSIAISWEYADLYDRLAADPGLPAAYRNDEFGRQRGPRVVAAMARIAQQCGVPYDFRRLNCNGQRKLLLKAGRVILMQEPILTLDDSPRSCEFKRELADTHAIVRQLELDLGDQPHRIRDWSGSIFGVILHGARGQDFVKEQKTLGGLLLGVPNQTYSGWLTRLDLHRIAMWGTSTPSEHAAPTAMPETQADNVNVTFKKQDEEQEEE